MSNLRLITSNLDEFIKLFQSNSTIPLNKETLRTYRAAYKHAN